MPDEFEEIIEEPIEGSETEPSGDSSEGSGSGSDSGSGSGSGSGTNEEELDAFELSLIAGSDYSLGTSSSGSGESCDQSVDENYEYENNLIRCRSTWKTQSAGSLFPGEDIRFRAQIWSGVDGLFLVRSSVSTIKATVYYISQISRTMSIWNVVPHWQNVSIDPEKTFTQTSEEWKYDRNEWNFNWKPVQHSDPTSENFTWYPMFTRTGQYAVQITMTFTDNRLPITFTMFPYMIKS